MLNLDGAGCFTDHWFRHWIDNDMMMRYGMKHEAVVSSRRMVNVERLHRKSRTIGGVWQATGVVVEGGGAGTGGAAKEIQLGSLYRGKVWAAWGRHGL